MTEYKLGVIERRFADLIWENAPISSGQLVRLCEQELQWKKSTTYTVLRRLCERGLFRNENGMVTPLVTMAEYETRCSQGFVQEAFSGSLPRFLAAFTGGSKLSKSEAAALRKLIDESVDPSKEG